MINVRSPETAIEDSGHSGFRVTGVGTGMLAGVFSDEGKDPFPVAGQDDQKCC